MNTIKKIAGRLAVTLLFAGSLIGQSKAATNPAEPQKKVAILPVYFIGDGNAASMDEMHYRLQNIVFQYLSAGAVELMFQHPSTTNAMLAKKGITSEQLRAFTPAELAEILEVDYVLTGRVTQEFVGDATHRTENRKDYERRGAQRRSTQSQSRTRQEMNTYIEMDIYNSSGTNIYTKSRKSILYDVGAYKNGLHYLLKRCPLYKR